MRRTVRLLGEVLAHPEVRPLAMRLKRHDLATYRHSLRVGRHAIALGEADGLDAAQVRELAVAALLHDLGKADLDLRVLRKPGALDAPERAHVRRHAAGAVGDLLKLAAFPAAHRIAPLHHEQEADESYPRSGRERRATPRPAGAQRRRPLPPWIRRAGRLLALADRYDALVARRSYKPPLDDAEARRILRAQMPDVADLLAVLAPPRRPPR